MTLVSSCGGTCGYSAQAQPGGGRSRGAANPPAGQVALYLPCVPTIERCPFFALAVAVRPGDGQGGGARCLARKQYPYLCQLTDSRTKSYIVAQHHTSSTPCACEDLILSVILICVAFGVSQVESSNVTALKVPKKEATMRDFIDPLTCALFKASCLYGHRIYSNSDGARSGLVSLLAPSSTCTFVLRQLIVGRTVNGVDSAALDATTQHARSYQRCYTRLEALHQMYSTHSCCE